MSLTAVTRTRSLLTAGLAVVLVGTGAACSSPQDGTPSQWVATPTSSTSAAPTTSKESSAANYSHLLLQAEDVSIPPNVFTARSVDPNPDGQAGASTLFVNTDETRAIADTVLIYPDAATASATLKQATGALSTMVVGGTPEPSPVGSGGTIISGKAPDGSKAVTLLLYTQGRALVRLEFDSTPDDPVPPYMVTGVGNMQQIALRIGLPERE